MRYSIITVSYNSRKTIERTILSILAQEVEDYEYIIVDGASEDGTMNIVHKYEPLFEGRMRCISEPDNGIYNAMNKGIKMATGDVIGIVNSDDWLETDALKEINGYIEENCIDVSAAFIITGNMRFHYRNGESVVLKSSHKRFKRFAKDYRMGLNHPATFVSKRCYDTIGIFDENLKIFADTDLIIRCYHAQIPIYFCNNVLSNMSDGGVSNQHSNKKALDRKYILRKYTKNKVEYFFLLAKENILTLIKKMPYSLIIKYRNLRNN